MTYKFYQAQVTGTGYLPQGDCKATLQLDNERNPTWIEASPDFEELCRPWFDRPTRLGVIDTPEPLEPYSEEALEHLSKHQLPSQGFVMVKVAERKQAPKPYGFQAPFIPPPITKSYEDQ